MSIGYYFKGNFCIFATDYKIRSLTYIYDYSIWRAINDDKGIIIISTTRKKYDLWNEIISYYDFDTVTLLRKTCDGFLFLEGVQGFYCDDIHQQNIIIFDGAKDLIFGKQSLEGLPLIDVKRRWRKYNRVTGLNNEIIFKDKREWDKFIENQKELYCVNSEDILNLMDDCPQNNIFLIAECEEDIEINSFKTAYPNLIKHGDTILGIKQHMGDIEVIPLKVTSKKPHHSINSEYKYMAKNIQSGHWIKNLW